jgi:hypothetical protein
MIRVAQYLPHHLAMIDVQSWQREGLLDAHVYAQAGPAWTAFDETGRAIFAGGLAWVGPGYAHGWAVLALGKGHALIEITRQVRGVLADSGFRRIDLFADPRRPAAVRWARLLGFKREGIKRAALADGGDLLVFAIINREGVCRKAA